jgi:transcriptional regulator with XRE-family HTH domain
MEDSAQAIAIRNRIVGALVKRARLTAGKSQKDCAGLLGCSQFAFGRFEHGQWGLSLGQLEALARAFGVPLANLIDSPEAAGGEPELDPLTVQQTLFLRRKILAVQFHQLRRDTGLSQQEMGRLLVHSPARVGQYERGERDIPLAELEVAAERGGRSLAEFFDEPPPAAAPAAAPPDGPAEWERHALDCLRELSPEVRDFVLKPTNILYLRIALLLSSMKADSLRQIAETLLDITY